MTRSEPAPQPEEPVSEDDVAAVLREWITAVTDDDHTLRELSPEAVLREVFDGIDADHDGRINRREV
jgi:hypothetical protein